MKQYDGEPILHELFEKALDFIKICQTEDRQLLIHCAVGASRAPSFISAYLMKVKNVHTFTDWLLSHYYHQIALLPAPETGLNFLNILNPIMRTSEGDLTTRGTSCIPS